MKTRSIPEMANGGKEGFTELKVTNYSWSSARAAERKQIKRKLLQSPALFANKKETVLKMNEYESFFLFGFIKFFSVSCFLN